MILWIVGELLRAGLEDDLEVIRDAQVGLDQILIRVRTTRDIFFFLLDMFLGRFRSIFHLALNFFTERFIYIELLFIC